MRLIYLQTPRISARTARILRLTQPISQQTVPTLPQTIHSPKIWLAGLDDVEHLNAIANHPEVYKHIGDGSGQAIDCRVSAPTTIIFASEFGAVLFAPCEGGWDLHAMFVPDGQGKHAHGALKSAIGQMFSTFSAQAIFASTPDDCPHAKPPRTFGFRPTGRIANCIRGVGATQYKLTLENWSKICPQH